MKKATVGLPALVLSLGRGAVSTLERGLPRVAAVAPRGPDPREVTRKWIARGAVLLVALLVANVASAEQRFTDPAGDSGGAPDLTVVTVANDAAGTLTFTVATNQPALAADAVVYIAFNTDKNNATGDRDGDEFVLFADANGWEFDRWDGTNYVRVSAPSAGLAYANGVLTFRIDKVDLGNVDSFFFYAVGLQLDAGNRTISS